MKKKLFLGIDTSNYMTSICFINEQRQVIFEERKLLEVKDGETGLQQSQAMFQHVKNLPSLFQHVKEFNNYTIQAVAVSKIPRPELGSYMPVFLAGVSVAGSIAGLLNIPLYETTHQEGHIAAGFYSSEQSPKNKQFLAIHLSGGTSELLYVQKDNSGYTIEKIGGTMDLHAGQLIDRIGVLLGFPFPSGHYIEQAAKDSGQAFERIPSSVKGYSFHFSGAEAAAKRKIEAGVSPGELSRAIEHVIAVSLEKVVKKAIEDGYPNEILIVGGVAQNQYVRTYLQKKLEVRSVGVKLFFAKKAYSGDNAFGVANIALDQTVEI